MKEAREIFQKSASLIVDLKTAFLSANQDSIIQAAMRTAECFAQGGSLLISPGNSPEIAQYLAGKFIAGFFMKRPPLPALALSPFWTGRNVFPEGGEFHDLQLRQMEALAEAGDILLIISDKAANIAPPLIAGREKGLFIIGLGEIEEEALSLCDIAIRAPDSRRAEQDELNLAFANLYGRLVDYFLFDNPLAGKQMP